MWSPPADHPLRRVFAGITEHAFQVSLGVADPPLIDYLSNLLSRFIHMDTVYRLKNSQGERLDQVVDMVLEAESLPPEGRTRREYHRHIGDFTLFWTGLYPEAVQRLSGPFCKDRFISYCEQGKRSYYIASSCDLEETTETMVLRRLSQQFEMCAYGLHQVRKEFEALQQDAATLHAGGTPKLLG